MVPFNFGEVFGEELARLEEQFRAHSVKEESFPCQLGKHKSSHFTHVHARDHLLISTNRIKDVITNLILKIEFSENVL